MTDITQVRYAADSNWLKFDKDCLICGRRMSNPWAIIFYGKGNGKRSGTAHQDCLPKDLGGVKEWCTETKA